MNRNILYARWCSKVYRVFAKAVAETDPNEKGYSKLCREMAYYRDRMITSSVNYV